LDAWLLQKEDDGWKLQWPTADGKLEEIKAGLIQRNIAVDGKLKKDDLSRILGRAQALSTLQSLALTTC
jgi:hypothetical protein